MKIGGNTLSAGLVGEVDERSAASTAREHKPDPASVTSTATLSQPAEGGEALTSEEPVQLRRIAAQSAPPNVGAPQQADDVHVAADSLMGTRILAVKSLLGDEASGLSNAALFDLANQIHSKAAALLVVNDRSRTVAEALRGATPEESSAIELAQNLFLEETRLWLDWNGGESTERELEKGVQAYRQAWDLTLHPPLPPEFKTRKQLAKEHIQLNKLECPKWYPTLPGAGDGMAVPMADMSPRTLTVDQYAEQVADWGEIKEKYFNQATDYIQKELGKLATLRTLAAAQTAGLGPRDLVEVPVKVWAFPKAGRDTRGIPIAFLETTKHVPLNDNEDNPPLLVEMTGNRYVLISPEGALKRLGDKAVDSSGKPLQKEILLALVDLKPNLTEEQRAAWVNGIKARPALEAKEITGNSRSLKELISQKNEATLTESCRAWIADNYDATGLYGLARNMVPFYKIVEDRINNKDFQLKFSDVAWDVVDLAITLGTIALSAGAGGAVVAGVRAFSTTEKTAVALFRAATAAAKQFKTGLNLSKLATTAGKEAVDFVLPVFTAKSLATGGVRLAVRGVATAADGLTDGARLLLGRLASNGAHLTHDIASGARRINVSDTRSLHKYALPSRPDNTRLSEASGVWMSDSGAKYAQVDNDFYRIAEDSAVSGEGRRIYKIEHPDGAADYSLKKMPMRLEFKDGKWKRVTDAPGLVGGTGGRVGAAAGNVSEPEPLTSELWEAIKRDSTQNPQGANKLDAEEAGKVDSLLSDKIDVLVCEEDGRKIFLYRDLDNADDLYRVANEEKWTKPWSGDPRIYDHKQIQTWKVSSDSAKNSRFPLVPTENVRYSRESSTLKQDRLDAHVARIENGQKLNPIRVRANADGIYEIVDGNHRLAAARKLGLKEVPIEEVA